MCTDQCAVPQHHQQRPGMPPFAHPQQYRQPPPQQLTRPPRPFPNRPPMIGPVCCDSYLPNTHPLQPYPGMPSQQMPPGFPGPQMRGGAPPDWQHMRPPLSPYGSMPPNPRPRTSQAPPPQVCHTLILQLLTMLGCSAHAVVWWRYGECSSTASAASSRLV